MPKPSDIEGGFGEVDLRADGRITNRSLTARARIVPQTNQKWQFGEGAVSSTPLQAHPPLKDFEPIDLAKLMVSSEVNPLESKSVFVPQTYEVLLALRDKEWTVRELFGRHDLMMVFGDSATGKSFFIIDLIVRGARGMNIANDPRFRCQPFRSLYCTEEGLTGLKSRVRAAFDHLGEEGSQNFRWIASVPNLFGGSTDKSVDDFIGEVKASGFRPGLIIFDTLADAIAGAEENDNGQATLMMAEARRIATELDCAVCFLHHTGKADKETQRGASAFRAKMDVSICVTGQANPRTMSCDKLKEGERWSSYTFDIVKSEDELSAILVWHSSRLTTKRDQNTELWQSSILQTLRDNASASERAMSVKEIFNATSYPACEKTARRWLATEANNPKSVIRKEKLQTMSRTGRPNKFADHYWIDES